MQDRNERNEGAQSLAMKSNTMYEPFQTIQHLHNSDILKVAISEDGTKLVSADDEGMVIVMHLNPSTKKFERKKTFKFEVREEKKVKCYDLNM